MPRPTAPPSVVPAPVAAFFADIESTSASDGTRLTDLETSTAAISSWKAPARAASTVNVAVATGLVNGAVVDGVTLATGNRVLLTGQTAGAENGLWTVVASGAASRSTDADSGAEVKSGMAVTVTEGTANGDATWLLTTNDPINLGVTALVFAKQGGGTIRVEDEGVSTVAAATALDFVGAGVTVTNAGSGEATVTIPGAAAGSAVGCKVYRSAALVAATGTEVVVDWDAEELDTSGFHDNVTNSSRLTIPSGQGGMYLVGVTAGMSTPIDNVNERFILRLYKNGVEMAGGRVELTGSGANTEPNGSVSVLVSVVATDYLTASVFHQRGSDASLRNGVSGSAFWLTRLGA